MTTKIAFGALGLACMVAAGGGAYLASRQNADDLAARAVATTAAPSDASTPAATAETEAVIDESKGAPTATPVAEAPDASIAPRVLEREPAAPATNRTTARTTRSTNSSPSKARTQPRSETPAAAPIATAPSVPANDPRPAVPTATEPDPATRPTEAATAPVEAAPPEPREPEKTFEELVVSADSVIGLQIENTITSERARIEDRVEARVTRDVKVGDRVAIPAGSRMEGSVTEVSRGGKIRERARLGIRFHTLVLADGTRVPVSTTSLFREGDPPARESASKIGGAAVGGAILGAILGGGKGAAAGAAAGAAGGTAAVMAGGRNAATLTAGSTVTIRVLAPVTITVEKNEQ